MRQLAVSVPYSTGSAIQKFLFHLLERAQTEELRGYWTLKFDSSTAAQKYLNAEALLDALLNDLYSALVTVLRNGIETPVFMVIDTLHDGGSDALLVESVRIFVDLLAKTTRNFKTLIISTSVVNNKQALGGMPSILYDIERSG